MSIRTITRATAVLLFVLLCAAALTGCASFWQPITTTTTTNSGTGYDLVYASKGGSNSFVGYSISSGGLTAVTGSPFSLTSAPLSMAITPANAYLYVGTPAGIYGYSIAAGGALTALSSGAAVANTPSVLANGPVSMDISPDGNWLAVLTNYTGGTVTILTYQITPSTGLLIYIGPVTASPISTTALAHTIKFSPNEAMLAATLGTEGTYLFTFNGSTGALATTYTHLTPPSSVDSDNSAIFNSGSSSLYLTRSVGTLPGYIYFYPVSISSSSGNVSVGTGAFVSTGDYPSALSFNNTTTQPYLYATNTNDATISGYSLNTSGTTTTVTGLTTSPYITAGTAPYAIAFDNSDTYMLAMNQTGPPDLIQYTVDTTAATAGRLYVTGSVTTGLNVASGALGPGVTMVTTHSH